MKISSLAKIISLSALVLCVAFHSVAQDDAAGKNKSLLDKPAVELVDAKPGDTPSKIIDGFFTLIARNQIDQAYDQLTNGTVIASNAKQLTTLKAKTREAVQLFGDIRGNEALAMKNVGTHLMCATYISLGRDFPLRWKFYFYKADKNWRLIDIGVDDRLADLFEDKTPAPAATPAGQ